MQLAYVLCPSLKSDRLILCLTADKPDSASVPLPVHLLPESENALIRLGPLECVSAKRDPADGGLVITPIGTSKLFVTPDQPNQPGIHALSIKVITRSDGTQETYWVQDRGRDTDMSAFKPWNPNRVKL